VTARQTLFKLIEDAGTLPTIGALLKSRGLPHSASSWDSMVKDRIRPALENGDITEGDLYGFLREAEEFGRQRVFLYRREERGLPDDRALRRWLGNRDSESVLREPLIVDQPAKLTIADARREQLDGKETLVIKTVETRTHRRLVSERAVGESRYVVEYELERVRAVNVARFHSDGLLEIRVHLHRSSGVRNYRDDLNTLQTLLTGLFTPTKTKAFSLQKAKDALWNGRATLQKLVRYSDSELRNARGNSLRGATGKEMESLFDDPAAEASMDLFGGKSDAYCDSLNVWWKAQPNGRPSKDIHLWLAGEANEFGVTQQCSRADYEHVLSELRRLSR
jgi:hypothetical protein